MPPGPVSSSGKVAIVNVEVGLLGSKGLISKLSGLPDWLMRTKFVFPGTDTRVILPPSVERVPVLTTVPPSKLKSCPDVTAKFAVLIIAPASAPPKVKEVGEPLRSV